MRRNLFKLVFVFCIFFRASAFAADQSTQSTETKGKFYSQISLSSWQDPLTLAGPGVAPVAVDADPIGICPGLGYRKSWSKSWSWDVNACIFIGRADADLDSNSFGSGLDYQAKNVFVTGLESSLGVLWTPPGQKNQIGFGVPFLLRYSSWPDPGSGFSVASDTNIHTGVLIETRFYAKSSLCFDPKLEWFQDIHRLMWSLNFTLDL
jgi:hypothetical protein